MKISCRIKEKKEEGREADKEYERVEQNHDLDDNIRR